MLFISFEGCSMSQLSVGAMCLTIQCSFDNFSSYM